MIYVVLKVCSESIYIYERLRKRGSKALSNAFPKNEIEVIDEG